jgi:hypothetical protein
MMRKDHFKIAWLFIMLGWVPMHWACSQSMSPANSHAEDGTASSMNMGKEIPPIDLAAAVTFETASFGLG